MTTTRKTMITATTMPRIDVTYDAFPRSFAVFLACGPPLYSFRRANTTVKHSQTHKHTQVIYYNSSLFGCFCIGYTKSLRPTFG